MRQNRPKLEQSSKPKKKPTLERNIKPKRKLRSIRDFDFDAMNPGDSFHYEGSRNSAIVPFVYRVASGFYKTEKEGDGWRFHLLKPLPKK